MATISVSPDRVSIRLTRAEKVLGLLRDLDVPVDHIRGVEVLPDGRAGVRGIRAPGLGLPRRLIGTWRRRGTRSLVSVRGRGPAVRLLLEGAAYDEAVLTVADPEAVADAVRRLLPG